MYQENKNSSSWIQIMLRSILVLLICILSIKLASVIVSNRTEKKEENIMQTNLQKMMDVAEDYFKEEELPKQIGESVKVSLGQLIEEDKLNKVIDEDGKACNNDESFIKITRLEKEFQYKTYLVCGKDTDYLNEFKDIDDIITIKPGKTTTTTTTTKKVTTTRKTTTTKNTTTTKRVTTSKRVTTTKKVTTKADIYKVQFNSNGGSSIATQSIKANDKVKEVIPYRYGYKFVGWYYHGSEFNFNTKINKDYILVAKWTK